MGRTDRTDLKRLLGGKETGMKSGGGGGGQVLGMAIGFKARIGTQGLQDKFYKVEQDCFGAPGTGWDFSQNWGFERVQLSKNLQKLFSVFLFTM